MKKTLLLPIVVASLIAQAKTFEQHWHEMQEVYHVLAAGTPSLNAFVHPYWHQQKGAMSSIIRGAPDAQFLFRQPISNTMVRMGYGGRQAYEVNFLTQSISERTKQYVRAYQDTSFGNLPVECQEFNCSTNTLGQLYYFAKIVDLYNCTGTETCVEFGGGYGCLCRIFKQTFKQMTYIIFDLPEFLALQHLFLTSTLAEAKVVLHTQIPVELEPGAIHLVPIYYLPQLNVEGDIFVSTFGISEAPALVQEMVGEKRFFSARLGYVTGQLSNSEHPFVNHETVFKWLNRSFKSVNQSNFYYPNLSYLYEVYALNSKN